MRTSEIKALRTRLYRTEIVKGQPHFARAAYGVAIIARNADGPEYLHDFHTFYGHDGRTVRSDAKRFASGFLAGTRDIHWYRTPWVTTGFDRPSVTIRAEDLPL